MDGWNNFPISLHLKGEETAPVSDERELRDNLDQIIDILKQGFLHLDIDPILNLSDPNTIYVGRYTEPLSDAFKALLSYDQTSYCVWLSIILNCQNIYSLTYNNETLLVMVDTENLISCLFFDAHTNRITGYSLDPKLVSLSMNKIRS